MRVITFIFIILSFSARAYGQICSNTNIGSGITCVDHKYDWANASSKSVTYPSGYAAGSMIVVAVEGGPAAWTSGMVSNTANYTWTFWGNLQANSVPQHLAIYYTKVGSLNSNSDTITVSNGGDNGMIVHTVVYSGLNSISGAGASATGSGTTLASGNYTVTTFDLNIGFGLGSILSAGSGWNDRSEDAGIGGNDPYTMVEDRLAASTTANAGFASQNSANWGIIGIAFHPVTAGGPQISSLSSPSALPGANITITGTAFGSSQGGSTVTVNGVSASTVSWTDTSIVATVPNTTTGNVLVTVSSIPSNAVPLTIGVVISSLTPHTGIVGSNFTIAGSSFGASQGGSTITLNGASTSVVSWTDTSIVATVPNTTTGNVVVTVSAYPSNAVHFRVGSDVPDLPIATVDTTMPTQAGTVRNVTAGSASDLQAKINAATCGDTIVVPANNTYTGAFTIPNEGACSGWIIVESSAIASLPASNHRVSTGSNLPTGGTLANMAKLISTATDSPTISFNNGAHNWRFIGLEITQADGMHNYSIVQTDNGQTVLSQLPSYITFDRCYVHGDLTGSARKGITFQVAYGAVIDSDIREIHDHRDGVDSQAIWVSNGIGPFLYRNNFISGGSENTMFGGATPTIDQLRPSDITIVGNYYWKDVTNWTGAGFVVKNLFELKNSNRVYVDGNVFEHNWTDGQNGYGILIRSMNDTGSCTWCQTNDVTFTHNRLSYSENGFNIDGPDPYEPSIPMERILIQNVVLDNMGGRSIQQLTECGYGCPGHTEYMTVDHNDFFGGDAMMYLGDSGTITYYKMTNNMSLFGNYGIIGYSTGTGSDSLNHWLPSLVYNDNLFFDNTGTPDGTWPNGTLWSTTAAAGFTNYGAGNYQLTGSTYQHAGTDGKDIGVWDWANYNNQTTNAIAGVWAPLTGFSSGSSVSGGVKFGGGVKIQ